MSKKLYSRSLDIAFKKGKIDLYENQLIITIRGKTRKKKAVIPLSHVTDVSMTYEDDLRFVVRGAYRSTGSWPTATTQPYLQYAMKHDYQVVFIDPVRTMDKIRQVVDKNRVKQLYLAEIADNEQKTYSENRRCNIANKRAEEKHERDLARYQIDAENRRTEHANELAQHRLDVTKKEHQYKEETMRYDAELTKYNKEQARNPNNYSSLSMPSAPASPSMPSPPPLNLPSQPYLRVEQPQPNLIHFWNFVNKYYEMSIDGDAQTIHALYSEMFNLKNDVFNIRLKGGTLRRKSGLHKANQKLTELLKDRTNTPPDSDDGLIYKDYPVTIVGQRVDVVTFDPNNNTENKTR